MYIIKNRKCIVKLFLLFWFLPTLMFVFSLFGNHMYFDNTSINNAGWHLFIKIMLNNMKVSLLIVGVGYVHKYAPVVMLLYNSVIFSITFLISFEKNGVLGSVYRLLPHAFLEVAGLTIFALLGMNIKKDFKNTEWKKSFIISTIIIIMAAFFEGYISAAIGE